MMLKGQSESGALDMYSLTGQISRLFFPCMNARRYGDNLWGVLRKRKRGLDYRLRLYGRPTVTTGTSVFLRVSAGLGVAWRCRTDVYNEEWLMRDGAWISFFILRFLSRGMDFFFLGTFLFFSPSKVK